MTPPHRTPPGVLGTIVARTVADLPGLGPAGPRTARPPGGFEAALARPGLSLIAELKPRSPSAGPLRDLDDNTVLDNMIDTYAPRARAVSVLVDGPYFGGGFGLLRRVRDRTDLPLLAKGFFVAEAQLDHALAAGADAVLLMAALLAPERLRVLLQAAEQRGLGALVEAHDDAELSEVVASGARVVGVNARDLATLAIDRAVCRSRLATLPTDRLRVAESGLHTAAHIDAVREVADAVLIGSAPMKAADPAALLDGLGFRPGNAPRSS